MKRLPFKKSHAGSLGIELEMQIINPRTWDLCSHSPQLLKSAVQCVFKKNLNPEVTQSMIEVNSSVHDSADELMHEMDTIHAWLSESAEEHKILICGGGTHPFERWSAQKIFPAKRYKTLAEQYRYLTKHATIFGLHIHVGCAKPDDAIYLSHALGRYVPHLFALSASSPFYQGSDTGFQSSRSTLFNAFPSCGTIPYFENWDEFTEYFLKMKKFKLVKTMKDLYWDVRPKPEFGTVEIRVCDTPLTMRKAVCLAAFLQTLSRYLLAERSFTLNHDMYYIYNYNRFQGARYGFSGEILDETTLRRTKIKDDFIVVLNQIEHYTHGLGTKKYLEKIRYAVLHDKTDANALRDIHSQGGSLKEVVREQCRIWRENTNWQSKR